MAPSLLDAPRPSTSPALGSRAAAPLRRLLATLRRQARRWIWVESLGWLGVATAVVFWLTLTLDWSIEPPAAVRVAMLTCGLAGLVWIVATKLIGRLLTPLSDAALARLVERTHPACGDSLSTAIDLADRGPVDIDPDLASRTTADALATLGDIRAAAIFRRRRLMLTAFAGVALLATIAAFALTRPTAAALWARRMLGVSNEPWPRRVSLTIEGFPGGVRTVARGSDVDVVVHAQARGGPPDFVELRVEGPDGWRAERMGGRGAADHDVRSFGHVLRSVVADTPLEIRGGDARLGGLRLRAVEPPALANLDIAYTLPAYLGGGERRAAPARLVRVPRGSHVRITCTATKPLRAARLVRDFAPAAAATVATSLAEFSGAEGAERRTLTGEIAALDDDATLTLELEDTDGLGSREPIRFVLSAVADEPPQLTLALPGVSTAVTPQASLPIEGTIVDDHGLAAAEVLVGRAAADPVVHAAIPRVRDGLPRIDLSPTAPEVVPLAALGLKPGERMTVVVEARDGCGLAGGPNRGRSDTWTLDVVTPEALRSLLEAREIMLRRRFETVIADLGQARDAVTAFVQEAARDAEAASSPAVRCGAAATRAAGETAEIATAFRLIRRELEINAVLTPELDARLVAQIAEPLGRLAGDDLPALARESGAASTRGPAALPPLVARVDEVLARMRAVLDTMLEAESFNDVVERLRAVIRTQEEIRAETLEQQRKRGRQALEGP